MTSYHTAQECWSKLDGERQTMLRRFERYAALTIPKVCYQDEIVPEDTDDQHDYQSLGAQGTNHLTNKMMLALFAPSRPFFRADAGPDVKRELAEAGMTETQIVAALGQVERDSAAELDRRAQRPKLYTTLRHLIVVGNVLQILDDKKEAIRVIGVKRWCVKRNVEGKVQTLIVRECVKFGELEDAVQAAVADLGCQPEDKVEFYQWLKLVDGKYSMTQWVKDKQLPVEFNGDWPEASCPYRVLTWDLADESDYGTGLVEEYSGDIEAMSVLSEAIVNGGVLAAEFRWLLNPAGLTSAEEFQNSENGAVIPGKESDLQSVQGGPNPNALQMVQAVLDKYERRVAQGFLMNSAVIRDAERVTAEEIRMTAQELETAFGGVYSSLASSLQTPIAYWLMRAIKVPKGLDLRITAVTGLEALSRNGDLDRLLQALEIFGKVAALPPQVLDRMEWKPFSDYVGNGVGIDLSPFFKTEEQYQQFLAANRAQAVQTNNAMEAGKAGAQAAAQGAT